MKLSRRQLLLGGGAAAIAAPGILGALTAPRGVEINVERDLSLWTLQLPTQPSFKPLDHSRKVDLAIIGAGYTGLSCAYYAKKMRPDWNVIVLESHMVGSGASSRNSGIVYARQVGINNQDFADRGFERLKAFIDDQQIDCDFMPSPTLILANNSSQAATLISRMTSNERWIPAPRLNERLHSRSYNGGVVSPGYYKIQPAKLLSGHLKAAFDVGVEVFEQSPATKIYHGKVVTINTPGGDVTASHAMVATNAYSSRLGIFPHTAFPIHQYTLATRQLTLDEINRYGLDQWTTRFEKVTLPVTFSLTPTRHFFMRMVLGYEKFDSQVWHSPEDAKATALNLFEKRYPDIRELQPDIAWHGVTGHTVSEKPVFSVIGENNVHIGIAYNGLGIMPGHNIGYLSASRITGNPDPDVQFLEDTAGSLPIPRDYYRNMMLQSVMKLASPV